MGNLQNYGGFDLSTFEEDDKEIAKSGKSNEFMTLEEGDNYVRFLPPPKDAVWAKRADGKIDAFKVVHQHFIQIPSLERKVCFVCPRMHRGADCPACSEADALIRTGNPFDKDKARDMQPSATTFCNIVDRNNEAKGPVVLRFPKTVRDGLKLIGKRPGGNFLNPTDSGFDVIITKTVKTGKTSYSVSPSMEKSPIGNEEWLDQQYNLDVYARVPTLEEVKDMLAGKQRERGGRSQLDGGSSRKQLGTGRPGRSERELPKRQRTAADDAIEAEFTEVDEDLSFGGEEELPE